MNVRISTGKCYAIRSLHFNDDNPTMPFIYKNHRGLETPYDVSVDSGDGLSPVRCHASTTLTCRRLQTVTLYITIKPLI